MICKSFRKARFITKIQKSKELENIKPPNNWLKIWNGIKFMREKNSASCDEIGDIIQENIKDKNDLAYQSLICAIITSMTRGDIVNNTMKRLKEKGLSINMISEIEQEKLEELLHGVCFHRRKAEYIKKSTNMIINEYNGKIPEGIEDLKKFPGVGINSALYLQQSVFNIVEGIAVDSQVHRVTNLLGWANSKTPEGTRKQLQAWLPKKNWVSISPMIVGFGQTICKPVSPNCNECKINHLCPSAFWNKKNSSKNI